MSQTKSYIHIDKQKTFRYLAPNIMKMNIPYLQYRFCKKQKHQSQTKLKGMDIIFGYEVIFSVKKVTCHCKRAYAFTYEIQYT